MADQIILSTPVLVTTGDTDVSSVSFRQCANYKTHPGPQGAVDVKILVVAGTVQFSVNNDPIAANFGVVAADGLISIRLWAGNVLKFKAAAGSDTFRIFI